MYLVVSAREGISSTQLAKEIGVTQKTAWFVLQRLREACGKELSMLKEILEVEEPMSGSEKNNNHSENRSLPA